MSDESLLFHELLDMAMDESPEAFKLELNNYKKHFNSCMYINVMNRKIEDSFTLRSVICEFRSILQKELPTIAFMKFLSVENEIYKHIFNIFEQFI